MESIMSATIDYSDQPDIKVRIDFFNDDGNIVYDLSIHSLVGHRDMKMLTPAAEALWLLQYLSMNVVTWDAETIRKEVTAWEVEREKLMRESELK